MLSRFRWNEAKAASNWRKHGVRFDDAATVFFDPFHLSIIDREHSDDEDRFVAVGAATTGSVLTVCYAVRDDEVRIISARYATRTERRRYMDNDQIHDGTSAACNMAEEYDFSDGVRGRHYIAPRGPLTVTLDPIVAEYFGDDKAVNDALRTWIAEGRVKRRK